MKHSKVHVDYNGLKGKGQPIASSQPSSCMPQQNVLDCSTINSNLEQPLSFGYFTKSPNLVLLVVAEKCPATIAPAPHRNLAVSAGL